MMTLLVMHSVMCSLASVHYVLLVMLLLEMLAVVVVVVVVVVAAAAAVVVGFGLVWVIVTSDAARDVTVVAWPIERGVAFLARALHVLQHLDDLRATHIQTTCHINGSGGEPSTDARWQHIRRLDKASWVNNNNGASGESSSSFCCTSLRTAATRSATPWRVRVRARDASIARWAVDE
jgi:hypothetical protein